MNKDRYKPEMITTIKYQNIHIVLYKYNYFYDYIVSIERGFGPDK